MGGMKDLLGDIPFDRPATRRTDPVTSHMAARDTTPKAGTNRMLVLVTHYNNLDGLTDYELADITGLQQNSAGKRRGELCKKNYIEETAIKRKAPSGSLAIVWRITLMGIALVEGRKDGQLER